MSEAQAHAFLDAVEADEKLRQRIETLRGAKAMRDLCDIAKEAGFSFGEQDYRDAVIARSDGELDDEALADLLREMSEGQSF